MPKLRYNWQSLFEAARRKISMAAYHASCLCDSMNRHDDDGSNAPSIPVQAHFEGVIVCIMAAVDQVAQAINSAFGLKLSESELVEGVFGHMAAKIPEINSWFADPMGRDLRRIRVRMVHYSYVKTQQGPRWAVESGSEDYKGSRELATYCENAVGYGKCLLSLLPLMEQAIANHSK